MAERKTITINRDARTGRIVTQDFAKKHPSTTERETRPAPKHPKKK